MRKEFKILRAHRLKIYVSTLLVEFVFDFTSVIYLTRRNTLHECYTSRREKIDGPFRKILLNRHRWTPAKERFGTNYVYNVIIYAYLETSDAKLNRKPLISRFMRISRGRFSICGSEVMACLPPRRC